MSLCVCNMLIFSYMVGMLTKATEEYPKLLVAIDMVDENPLQAQNSSRISRPVLRIVEEEVHMITSSLCEM